MADAVAFRMLHGECIYTVYVTKNEMVYTTVHTNCESESTDLQNCVHGTQCK